MSSWNRKIEDFAIFGPEGAKSPTYPRSTPKKEPPKGLGVKKSPFLPPGQSPVKFLAIFGVKNGYFSHFWLPKNAPNWAQEALRGQKWPKFWAIFGLKIPNLQNLQILLTSWRQKLIFGGQKSKNDLYKALCIFARNFGQNHKVPCISRFWILTPKIQKSRFLTPKISPDFWGQKCDFWKVVKLSPLLRLFDTAF